MTLPFSAAVSLFQFDVSTAKVLSIPELIFVLVHGSIAIPRKVETKAAMNMAGNPPISDRTPTGPGAQN